MIPLLFLSAFLYAVSFVFIQHAWWCIFLFPLPLLLLHKHISFYHGFAWGLIAYSISMWGICDALVRMALTHNGAQFILPIFFITYFAGNAGLFFGITGWIEKKVATQQPIIILRCCMLFAYIFFVDQLAMWPLGTVIGIPLVHPLVPLTQMPPLLYFLPYVGKQGLIALILGSSALCALSIYNRCYFILLLLLCAVWSIGFFVQPPPPQWPCWLDDIGVLPMVFSKSANPVMLAQIMADECHALHKKIIIIPESCVYEERVFPFLANLLDPDVHLIAGSFYMHNDIIHNTVYWLHNGSIVMFHKKLLTPGVEQMPQYLPQWIHKLYFNAIPSRTPADNKRSYFVINNRCTLVAYICSELFCYTQPDDTQTNIPILGLCNDMWFSYEYPRTLMQSTARIQSIKWQRPIVYISYYHTACYDSYGRIKKIATID